MHDDWLSHCWAVRRASSEFSQLLSRVNESDPTASPRRGVNGLVPVHVKIQRAGTLAALLKGPMEGDLSRLPDGFAVHRRSSPFLDMIGPLYSQGTGLGLQLALRIDTRHTNSAGSAHGGVLAALIDVAIGYAITTIDDSPMLFTTASITLSILSAARIDDIVTTATELQHRGSRLVFANATLSVDNRRVACGSGIFVPGPSSVRKAAARPAISG